MYGSPEPSEGAGIGNLLVYFPALYYFAAFTGRDIIISDKSIVGEMCKIITCGFPFASEMALAFPAILGKGDSHALKKSAELLGVQDFIRYLEGTRKLKGNGKLIYAFGYKSESAWWQYFNTTVQCVQKLTGCDLGDIGCADRHAFQRLVRGPFKGMSLLSLYLHTLSSIHAMNMLTAHPLVTHPLSTHSHNTPSDSICGHSHTLSHNTRSLIHHPPSQSTFVIMPTSISNTSPHHPPSQIQHSTNPSSYCTFIVTPTSLTYSS